MATGRLGTIFTLRTSTSCARSCKLLTARCRCLTAVHTRLTACLFL